MADEIKEKTPCSFVDGVASTPSVDTSGEIVDLAGIDCSSLISGALNWEHKSDIPAQIVGKILEYKKIFSEQDCENDRHKYYFDKVKGPFLYAMGRLFDDKKDSSKECAALFLDDAEHPDEHPMIGFSIEGSKIEKKGLIVTKSIARKITITNANANKQCVAELVKAPQAKESPEDSIFKSEVSHTISLSKTEDLIKAEMPKSSAPKSPTASKPIPAPKGWTGKTKQGQHGTEIHFHHPMHQNVTVHKDKESGDYHVKHRGGLANVSGIKGKFKTPKEAHEYSFKFMDALSSGKTAGNASYNRPSPEMIGKEPITKAMAAGSGMGTPGSLVQGAALGKEELDKKMKKADTLNAPVFSNTKGKDMRSGLPGIKAGAGTSYMGSFVRQGLKGGRVQDTTRAKDIANKNLKQIQNGPKPDLGKSELLQRAEQEYKAWSKKEAFEDFMAKTMPNLTKGEVQAIGQTLCLRKSMKAEKKLAKMVDQGQQSWFEKSKK